MRGNNSNKLEKHEKPTEKSLLWDYEGVKGGCNAETPSPKKQI